MPAYSLTGCGKAGSLTPVFKALLNHAHRLAAPKLHVVCRCFSKCSKTAGCSLHSLCARKCRCAPPSTLLAQLNHARSSLYPCVMAALARTLHPCTAHKCTTCRTRTSHCKCCAVNEVTQVMAREHHLVSIWACPVHAQAAHCSIGTVARRTMVAQRYMQSKYVNLLSSATLRSAGCSSWRDWR